MGEPLPKDCVPIVTFYIPNFICPLVIWHFTFIWQNIATEQAEPWDMCRSSMIDAMKIIYKVMPHVSVGVSPQFWDWETQLQTSWH